MAAQSKPSGSTPLPRGTACLNCKRRKIKCDGVQPVCGPCRVSSGFDDCEFPGENPSIAQQLEEDIERMEERIRELEQSAFGSGGPHRVELQNPYPRPTSTSPSTSRSSRHRLHLPAVALGPGSQLPPSHWQLSLRSFEEPSRASRHNLFGSFRQRGIQIGVFLQQDELKAAFMLPLPIGHPYRPAPSLIFAIYLWTAHLMQDAWDEGSEKMLLTNALEQLNLDLSANQTNRTMQVLQAEILLSYYFLMNKDNVSAIVHVNSAISMTVGTGLHLVGAATATEHPHWVSPFGSSATDSITEGEKVFAFWCVVILSNFLAVLEPSQHSTFYDSPHFVVDTPWPLETSSQSMASTLEFDFPFNMLLTTFSNFQILQGSQATLSRFLDGSSVDGTSPLALLSKASVLLKKSIYWKHEDRQDSDDRIELESFNALIERFISGIPLPDQFGISQCSRKAAALSSIISRAATIYLYSHLAQNDELFRNKCVSMAVSIAIMMKDINEEDIPALCPVLGPILGDICGFLVRETERYQSNDSPIFRRETDKLRSSAVYILETMTRLSGVNPSIAASLQRFQESNPQWR